MPEDEKIEFIGTTESGEEIIFEGKRMPVQFFRTTEYPSNPIIREQYEREAFIGMHSIGGAAKSLIGLIRIVQGKTGLADAFWQPAHKVGVDETAFLHEAHWALREHIRGAVLKFLAKLNDIDRDDAMKLTGRHEGHHLHVRGLSLHCSCDDEVILTYWSGVPPRHPERLSCTECGKKGMTFSAPRD